MYFMTVYSGVRVPLVSNCATYIRFIIIVIVVVVIIIITIVIWNFYLGVAARTTVRADLVPVMMHLTYCWNGKQP